MISIIMPVHNGSRFLEKSIESIIFQTYKNWELILVDDFSTDNSIEIMKKYQKMDERIKIISNSENLKLPKSLNIGFENARGDYFTWTSDDNEFKKNALEVMRDYLINNKNMGMVYADMDYIDENGEKTGEVSSTVSEILEHNCIGACFLYTKEVAINIGRYDSSKFLVEDYDYWLRIAEKYNIFHIPQNLYRYRKHENSLTEKREKEISIQLYKLRMEKLDFLIENMNEKQKEQLFTEMSIVNNNDKEFLSKKLLLNENSVKKLQSIGKEIELNENTKIALFGAGEFGRKALNYFGENKVLYFIDNNSEIIGNEIKGIKIISFDTFLQVKEKIDLKVVISVNTRIIPILAEQLENAGIYDYCTYVGMVNKINKPKSNNIDYLEVAQRAMKWIYNNTNINEGIINNTSLKESYPEVTGYFIPTLIRWGEKELAVLYARWLCSIQHEDGSWYDAKGNDPYVFDSAQILKGLIAIRKYIPEIDINIKKGCDWIISNINEEGRLTTPSKSEWGTSGVCSELIHLYCISPIYDASILFNDKKYKKYADKVVNYYITNYRDEILDFKFLSHFYAYVMEALCDIGYSDVAREGMNKLKVILEKKKYIPAYNNVDWVCSTGMFQLAIVWYKLGDQDLGNICFEYAISLQNESGGWYGSYPVVDNPNPKDICNYPDYFPEEEISWANKYFFDALYYKNKCEFDLQSGSFNSSIERDDERYMVVLEEVQRNTVKRICDVGCGKGRYLLNLLEDETNKEYYGVDVSEKVMESIPKKILCKQGLLTNIDYPDEFFDLVYSAEALEHSIFPENALKEMIRVTKKEGKIIIIDKNIDAKGTIEIDEWEQWFDDKIFIHAANENNCTINILQNLMYEGGVKDGLFNAWILCKR